MSGGAYSVDVEVTAPVYPTEVEDRVADAVLNVFPDADVEREEGELRAHTHSVERFAERLREQAILDTARGQLLADRRGDVLRFALKKQAAFEGVVNFAVGEPDELGELHVSVRVGSPDVESFVDGVAPPTEDGVPVDATADDGGGDAGPADGGAR